MGRHKFRLSDMIPNAWFFKLRDMRARGGAASPRVAAQASAPASRSGRTCGVPSTPRHGAWLPHRASHYYTPRAGDLVGSPLHPKASDTHFPPLPLSPPRRSRRRHRRRSVKLAPSVSSSSGFVTSPVSTGCRCGRSPEMVVVEAPDTPPSRRDRIVDYSDDEGELKKPTVAMPAEYKLDGEVVTSATEIIIDLRTKKKPEKVLRPIVTKPARREPDGCEQEDRHIDVLTHAARRTAPVLEQSMLKPRRSVSSARRLKTRSNTPRMVSNKCKPPAMAARSPVLTKPPPLAESFAVVKSSQDPRRDFQESMEEMIVENGIRTAVDLEDLLACYLSLNAAEYHDLIVEVFEHIWATLADIKM
uniref:Transcription repressor n=1 Tax=Arundo donax TaxID=35708 RepID=A0A0A9CY88_ARUDO